MWEKMENRIVEDSCAGRLGELFAYIEVSCNDGVDIATKSA